MNPARDFFCFALKCRFISEFASENQIFRIPFPLLISSPSGRCMKQLFRALSGEKIAEKSRFLKYSKILLNLSAFPK